ncbi:MAG TPA: FHA domain-containing protein [Candidatus Acidoferrales bacterium]|nr:FHA domain-containing protein [Candidatus Acidoferrales bacterium]
MPRIVVQNGSEGSSVLELIGDHPVTIGRAKSSRLMLDDASVSRLHAVVRATMDGRWQVIDRDSANGVKVNGVTTKETVLRGNDEITIGIYKLRFEDSTGRKVASYGTTDLPKKFVQAIKKSGYSGSAAAVTSLEGVGSSMNPAEREQAQEREKQLMALLHRVNQGMMEMKSQEDLTQRVLDFALEIPGVERGFLMLLDEESEGQIDFSKGNYNFLPAKIRHRKKGASSPNAATPQLAISQSIIRKVMEAGLPMLVTDGQADARFSASLSIVKAGIQSAMCAPLGMGNRIRGLIYVDNLSQKRIFTVDDLNAFAVIAVQAGLAIDRVRGRGAKAEKPIN